MTEAQMNNAKTTAEDTTVNNEQTQAPVATEAVAEESSSWGWKTWTGVAVGAAAVAGLAYWGYKEFFGGDASEVVSEVTDAIVG